MRVRCYDAQDGYRGTGALIRRTAHGWGLVLLDVPIVRCGFEFTEACFRVEVIE